MGASLPFFKSSSPFIYKTQLHSLMLLTLMVASYQHLNTNTFKWISLIQKKFVPFKFVPANSHFHFVSDMSVPQSFSAIAKSKVSAQTLTASPSASRVLNFQPLPKVYLEPQKINPFLQRHLQIEDPWKKPIQPLHYKTPSKNYFEPSDIQFLPSSFVPKMAVNPFTIKPNSETFKISLKVPLQTAGLKDATLMVEPSKNPTPPPSKNVSVFLESKGDDSLKDDPTEPSVNTEPQPSRSLSLLETLQRETQKEASPYKLALLKVVQQNAETDNFLGDQWLEADFKDHRLNFLGTYFVTLENVLCILGETLAAHKCGGNRFSGLPAEFELKLPRFARYDMVEEALDLLHHLQLITPEEDPFNFF